MNKCELPASRHDHVRVQFFDDSNELSGGLDGTVVVPTERMVIDIVARHSRVIGTDENSGTRREFEPAYPDEAKRPPMIPCRMNDAQYVRKREGDRTTEMTVATISKESVLSELQKQSCLDLRQLAALHGTDVANDTLLKAIADLMRRGKITRIGGRGPRTSFVPATFER